jgi:excisionase family DNA binding protein
MSRLMTIGELSDYLKVPTQTLYQWRTKGYGPKGVRIGKHIRYDEQDVRAWVEKLKKVA